MGYTLQLTPSEDDATIASLVGGTKGVGDAPALNRGPTPGASQPLSRQFFIRASELLPRVKTAYGQPDITGVSATTARSVLGHKGVLLIEDCYQTPGDKKLSFLMYQPMTGDHWDLYNGINMVAEGYMLAGNSHKGTMYFWKAR
jgi:hypothetical protein